MSKLPPWTGDDAAMQRWLDDKLDELLKEDGAKARARRRLPLSREEKEALFPEDSDEGAIAAAERGDIEPLRRRLPKFSFAVERGGDWSAHVAYIAVVVLVLAAVAVGWVASRRGR